MHLDSFTYGVRCSQGVFLLLKKMRLFVVHVEFLFFFDAKDPLDNFADAVESPNQFLVMTVQK